MKKILYSFGLVVLSSALFAACQKEAAELTPSEAISPIEKETPVEMVTFNFSAEKAGVDTKTQVVLDEANKKASYEWTDEDTDNIKLYLVDGESLTEVASPTITKVSATKLTITATVPKADSYTFRAVLSREFYSKGKPMVSKYQSPKTDNYDPKGDILFSDDLDIDTDGTSTGEMLLTFHRKVAVSEMTLKNLGVGEKISKVEITGNTDGLVGYYNGTSLVDLSDQIVLTYANEVVPTSGQFVVYFTSAPITDQTLTVKVTTDANTYTKEFARTISFAQGTYRGFGVSLPAGEEPADTWNLVTSSSTDLADGDIVYLASYGATYGMGAQSSNIRSAISATPLGGGTQITPNVSFQEVILEATSTNFYLKVGDDQYIYANNSKNNYIGVDSKTTVGDNGKFSITLDSDGNAKIQAQGTNTRNVIKYNYNSGSPRFSCYADNTTEPELSIYRKEAADATVWNLSSISVTTAPTKDEYSSGEAFNSAGMVVMATFVDNAGLKSNKVITLSNSDLTVSPSVLSAEDTKVTLSYLNKTVDVTGLTVSDTDYSQMHTSNVTISAGSNSSSATVVIDGSDYQAIKCGTSSKAGAATVTVPAGSTKLYVHIAGWNGESKTVNVTPKANISKINKTTATSLTTTADSGISGSSPYTFTLAGTDKLSTSYFYEIDLTGISSETDITFTAGIASSNRFVIWGCNAQ